MDALNVLIIMMGNHYMCSCHKTIKVTATVLCLGTFVTMTNRCPITAPPLSVCHKSREVLGTSFFAVHYRDDIFAMFCSPSGQCWKWLWRRSVEGHHHRRKPTQKRGENMQIPQEDWRYDPNRELQNDVRQTCGLLGYTCLMHKSQTACICRVDVFL